MVDVVFDNKLHDPYTMLCLTLKAPNKNCNRRHLIFFYFYLSKKIRLDVSWESSAQPRIHIKYQILYSLKKKEYSKIPILRLPFGLPKSGPISEVVLILNMIS